MKTSLLISAIAACAMSGTVALAHEPTAAGGPAVAMEMGMKMEKPMQQPMAPMPPMPATVETMQQQMEQIGTTTDPQEHQKLMDAHMLTMQENMKAMREMGTPAVGNAIEARQQMIERRMDMMQLMMEQLMKRDQATPPAMPPMSDM